MRFTALLLLAICIVHVANSELVQCGKWTTKTVQVGQNTNSGFNTNKGTRRCSVLFKIGPGCEVMKMFCRRFFLPNRDDYRCRDRKGDVMQVKTDGEKPRVYCNHRKPTPDFPVMSTRSLKATVKMARPYKKYPNRGATCFVSCDKP
eukprot:GFUD01008562.1.p1 GENE.GFUD01008562.1~~GFUD01008562.1.p1  ORF type:complete len:147 (+),score=22.51 GFUD01008562.1:70-510(+)